VAILVRFAWVYSPPICRAAERRLREPSREAAPARAGIISWCGMRGIVSLAAALALPATLPERPAFPGARPDHLPDLLRDRRPPWSARA
jgi:NhaP-type Na+/H+ or K+/H+ antiporter